MNRNMIKMAIVAWVLVLVLCFLAFGSFAARQLIGSRFPLNVMSMPFQLVGRVADFVSFGISHSNGGFVGRVLDLEGYTEHQDLSITQEINSIELDWVSGDVRVLRSPNSEVRVVHQGNTNPKKRMMIKVENGSLSITDHYPNQTMNIASSDVELYLPEKMYHEIAIDTVSADIESVYLQCSKLKIDSVSGNIELECYADEADFETVSGRLSINNAQIDELDANSVSGDIEIMGTAERVDLESVSGTSKAKLQNLPEELDIESVSGDVHLALPENDGFDLTTSGFRNINSQFAFTRSGDDHHRYKNGGPQYDIDTLSGKLVLTIND